MRNLLRFLSSNSPVSLSLSSFLSVVCSGDESSGFLSRVTQSFLSDPFRLLRGYGEPCSIREAISAPLDTSGSASECDEGVVNGGGIPVQYKKIFERGHILRHRIASFSLPCSGLSRKFIFYDDSPQTCGSSSSFLSVRCDRRWHGASGGFDRL